MALFGICCLMLPVKNKCLIDDEIKATLQLATAFFLVVSYHVGLGL